MTGLRRLRVDALAVGRIELSADEIHYAKRVLRLADGASVAVFDGKGKVGTGVLQSGAVEVSDTRQVEREGGRITLAVAPPKGERADWLVEKVSELGVARLVWLQTERSVSTINDKKLERQRRIACAAARQSGQAFVTELDSQVTFEDHLHTTFDGRWIAHPDPSSAYPATELTQVQDVGVLIGPEGGFTDHEVSSAINAGYATLDLGRSILRIETAAVVASTLFMRALERQQ